MSAWSAFTPFALGVYGRRRLGVCYALADEMLWPRENQSDAAGYCLDAPDLLPSGGDRLDMAHGCLPREPHPCDRFDR